MASVQLQTATLSHAVVAQPSQIVKTGARLWAGVGGGADTTNPGACLYYSDNDGVSWTKHSQLATQTNRGVQLAAYQDTGSVWHLHTVTCATSGSTSSAMTHRAIHSNVDSGVPAAATTAINLDAGGTGLGAALPAVFITNTALNPRIWVVYRKNTTATVFEARVMYAGVGTTADTLLNWTTLTDVGALSGASNQKYGTGCWWKTSGVVDQATILVQAGDAVPASFRAFTFDPTALTPALGTATTMGALSSGIFTADPQQPLFVVAAKTDYLVFGRMDPQASNAWQFYKTVDGTTWTTPTGWNITIGRAAIACDGTDFWVLHANSYIALATASTAAFSYRKITAATNAMGTATAFSDTQGNAVAVWVAGGKLFGIYRAGTASPYPVRADSVTVAAGGASFTLTLTASQAQTATEAAAVSAVYAVTQPQSATRIVQAQVTRGATQPQTATRELRGNATRPATQPQAATVATTKVSLRTLTATQTQTATATRSAGLARTAAQPQAATRALRPALPRTATQPQTAAAGRTPTLSRLATQAQAATATSLKVLLRTLTATQPQTATRTVKANASRVATQPQTATRALRGNATRPATQTQAATAARGAVVARAAAQPQTATVARQPRLTRLAGQAQAAVSAAIRAFLRTLTATQPQTATTRRVVTVTTAATQTQTATQTRQARVTRTATQTTTAGVARYVTATRLAAQPQTATVSTSTTQAIVTPVGFIEGSSAAGSIESATAATMIGGSSTAVLIEAGSSATTVE